MKRLDEIITAIEACTAKGGTECERCAYRKEHDCQDAMDMDALEMLKKYRSLRTLIQQKRREVAT